LPTFHPAAVLRQWDLRATVLADLVKAHRQMEFPEIRRPRRVVAVAETLDEVQFYAATLSSSRPLAVDVETRKGQITCIGFSQHPAYAFVVPFIRGHKDHYWPAAREHQVLQLVATILQSPAPKVFQNGLYDLHYIWRTWRIAPRNCLHDTMLRHHAEYPELPKSLGFMGSVYTDELSWKLMRASAYKDTEMKADDA
jgi:hypothetical protein